MKRSLWRGSTLQSIAVIVLPLTLLLVIISLGSFSIHQNAMRSLVGERDKRSAQTAASAIESEINHRLFAIHSLALISSSNPPESLDTITSTSATLLGDFDYGTAFFQPDGTLLAATGNQVFWHSLSVRPELAAMLAPVAGTAISAAFPNPVDNKPVVLVSSRTNDGSRVAVGAFLPEALIRHTFKDILPSSGDTAIYVIDSNFQILFHSGPTTLESGPASHPGVAEAFKGQSGTTYMKVGQDEHVVAFSPIQAVNWAIVTEESWETVSSPTLRTSQIIPLVLIPALLLTALALWFGARQIVRPLQNLESKAAKLAWGDFHEIEESVGGIVEIRDLQNELAHMARQLKSAEQSLHSYIGAITLGQEEERRRLARELHDDTIQSLIALKQRVQLARMPHKKDVAASALEELESLIEQTIDDLRRTTRALRPIYLEDLGLVAALEMLMGETSQTSGLPVDFTSSGTERRLPAEVELALYRMAQEALNNAAHHAQAKHASVHLEYSSKAVMLDISDEGKGFNVPKTPAEFAPQGHFGLLGLYERAELIGAHLDITSSIGQGTRLSIYLPYSAEKAEGE
jgi:signal transduction histidine kinase